MKFLADENIPRSSVRLLRARGMDLAWMGEVAPGAGDEDVLAECVRIGRVLITLDKDFGELAQREALGDDCGVVLLRVTPQEIAQLVLALLQSGAVLHGHFSVVTRQRVRTRKLQGRTR
jgi:predicted nuclease of predicted toxin-antitoxin system